jgi:hypothetical protein
MPAKGQKNQRPGVEAELKRMELPYGSMMSESFHILRQRLSVHMHLEPINEMALALLPASPPIFNIIREK